MAALPEHVTIERGTSHPTVEPAPIRPFSVSILKVDPGEKPDTTSAEIHTGYKTHNMGTTEEDNAGGSHLVT